MLSDVYWLMLVNIAAIVAAAVSVDDYAVVDYMNNELNFWSLHPTDMDRPKLDNRIEIDALNGQWPLDEHLNYNHQSVHLMYEQIVAACVDVMMVLVDASTMIC